MSDYDQQIADRNQRLVEAGYSEVFYLGNPFARATSCAKCGAMVLLGEVVDLDGKGQQVEKNLLAHSLWHVNNQPDGASA